ncbi:ABC-type bacteriocin/lantibiotic exporter with double-glycine peptidase domain [Enterococcus sp. PF1-24]|uniref:peptidase domain-containing ABC transporter n=1 Tax=unclassified Enterococcus TaxID=2608891 RepID=UPI002474E58F|nr:MULTISPECIES: peptidase domain-containing ABC transporter [unclassified Enterococcus]MDH6363682.1 ABC-type bacteriocin/lantibiotic exporter with double-glycine peptidase domain [Enterococcus sp. PFB1-1]MDH6400638.1 ABC-type bacteriocin/lantibiotic exporter with double-glycine peptidase domain [Enterococcus sp. PF1-24]
MSLWEKKVPYVSQMSQNECGLCCIAMILNYYDSYETIHSIRRDLGTSRDGTKVIDIKNILIGKGFNTKIYAIDDIDLLTKEMLPAILYWNKNHFVVLENRTQNDFYIVDPTFGRMKLSKSEFLKKFSRIIITCVPNDSFVKVPKPKNVWVRILFKVFNGNKKKIISTLFWSILSYFLLVFLPITTQNLIDLTVAGTVDPSDEKIILLLFLMITIYSFSIFFRGKSKIALAQKIESIIASNTFSHLLKVPYNYFETRNQSDLLYRLNSIAVLKELFSESIISGVINIGLIIFIGIYMVYSSIELSIISAVLLLINLFFVFVFKNKLKELTTLEISRNSELQGLQSETILSILYIKLSGMEKDTSQRWKRIFGDSLKIGKRKMTLQNSTENITEILGFLSPLVLLLFGLKLYLENKISLGTIVAFQTLSNTFFSAGNSLSGLSTSFTVASAYLIRIFDILDTDIEQNSRLERKINGNISLSNVCFSYGKNSPKVLNDISLDIHQGQRIALVGKSGSGKSTLGKILLGLYDIDSGIINYDGTNIKEFNKPLLRKQIGFVPQEVTLFNKSIKENITLGNKQISDKQILKACRRACIDSEIDEMPMKYETQISDLGMNVSGGQKQRLAFARAIINNPKIVVLDEATSSLDIINEKNIVKYLKKIECTQIIIAHRLSTIKDCDMIFVLKDGEIVESGTHSELINLQGEYFNLYNI